MLKTVEKERKAELANKIAEVLMRGMASEDAGALPDRRKRGVVVKSITEAFNLGRRQEEETKRAINDTQNTSSGHNLTLNNNTISDESSSYDVPRKSYQLDSSMLRHVCQGKRLEKVRNL